MTEYKPCAPNSTPYNHRQLPTMDMTSNLLVVQKWSHRYTTQCTATKLQRQLH